MSAMVLAYVVATAWLQKRYAAKLLYIVGMILLVGFLLPFRPVFTVETGKAPEFIQSIAYQETQIQSNYELLSAERQDPTLPFPWQIVFTVWIAGVFVVLLYHAIRHLHFIRAVKRWRVEVKDECLLALFNEAKRDLRLENRKIGFAYCTCIHSPMLLWLDKPTVLLPTDTQNAYDMRFILLHELTHYRRKDLLSKLLMLCTTAMHWFNPLIYVLAKLVVSQCEISCDEKVVEGKDIDGRHRYALSIIGAAQSYAKGYNLLTTHFFSGKNTMKKRITSIYKTEKTKLGIVFLSAVVLITVIAGTSIAVINSKSAIALVLPEKPIQFDEPIDSYIVRWEPLEDIQSYHLGIYFEVETHNGDTVWFVSGGYAEASKDIVNDKGIHYTVSGAIWDSITVDGQATEADISRAINRYMESDSETAFKVKRILRCHMTMVAIPKAEAPILMYTSLPMM